MRAPLALTSRDARLALRPGLVRILSNSNSNSNSNSKMCFEWHGGLGVMRQR
jgi:hypothetical protein